MPMWSSLWNHRHEPVLARLSLALLGLVVVAIVLALFQYFVRAAPLTCKGIWLPATPEECPDSKPPSPPSENIPVGAILPFFGLDEHVPDGWVICDGRDAPDGSKILLDANAEKGGIQLPDLRSKFVRGASKELNKEGSRTGGKDTIDLNHSHLWAKRLNDGWYSYENKEFTRVDDWGNGIGDDGEGNQPLSNDKNLELYTDNQGNEYTSILPSFVELRYIIRVR